MASVAAMACAIGAVVVTWSLLSAVLLKPLPVAAPERLFEVDWKRPAGALGTPSHRYPVFESIRDSGTFDGIAAVGTLFGAPMLVTEVGDVPHGRQVYFAEHSFFATLGIRAVLGRTFAKDEDRRGASVVAVLSDRYWRSVFNADPNVLGRTVTISGTLATIVGVLPSGFRGLHLSESPDLYLPLHVAGDIDNAQLRAMDPLAERVAWIRIVGRLRPGDTAAAAAARLNALNCMCAQGLTHGELNPLFLTNVNTAAIPEGARAGLAQFATLLSITVGLLLLVGCLTVGMLLLVRTEDRGDELAVRFALGATRTKLAVSIVAEAAILCALGAMLAVPVALWLFYGIRAFQLPGSIDIERLELTLAAAPWLAVTGAALAATCVMALLACVVGVRGAARSALQSRALATPRVTRRASRTALVAGQVAITLVLVTGAGLFTRSLIEALSLNSEIETGSIITAGIDLGQYGYTPQRAAAFIDDLLGRLSQNGAVESASTMQSMGVAQAGVKVSIDGEQRELPSGLQYIAVDDSYFSTIGLPIVSGRSFIRSDTASSP